MYEITSLVLEFLILVAVVWEGLVSHKHYQLTRSKKERATQKRKATKIIKKVLG